MWITRNLAKILDTKSLGGLDGGMARPRLLSIYDDTLDGKLSERLRAERAKDPATSYEQVARAFAEEYGITVTDETVRQWYRLLEREGSAA